MKEKISVLLKEACEKLELMPIDFDIDFPEDLNHGDLTSNIALKASKDVGLAPNKLAQKLCDFLNKNLPEEIEKVEIAGPGFLNFFFSQKYLEQALNDILNETFPAGKNSLLAGRKILIEHTNTNVFKAMHIGHLFGNIIGSSLSRIFQNAGAEVKQCSYQGDVGLNVAKCIWGILQHIENLPQENDSLEDKINFLNDSYSYGSRLYEEDEKTKREIQDLNKKIYEKSDVEMNDLYQKGRKWSLEHFDEMYKKLSTHFDYFFFESEVAESALKIIQEHITDGIFEESEGAVIYRGEKKGLHTRVFINSLGLPTYDAKEIAHAINRFKVYPANQSIIITANEQDNYFKVVLSALAEINSEIASHIEHFSHGLLSLTSGKMSSRAGNTITGEDLIKEIQKKTEEIVWDREYDEDEKKEIIEKISLSAIKFSILKQSIGTNIVFDPEKSLSLEGDSGPYVTYASVRAGAVLSKAEEMGLKISSDDIEKTDLLRFALRFPAVVERAVFEKAPHQIANFLLGLASSFNSFYAQERILESEKVSSRLALVSGVQKIIESGLWLLGIDTPRRM